MQNGIAIDFFGIVVGSATIEDDGTLILESFEPSEIGASIGELIGAGQYTGLSILPKGMPMPPPPPPAPVDETPTQDPDPETPANE